MSRAMILALLAFGLAALTFGQSVDKASLKNAGTQTSLQVAANPVRLDFGDQVVQTISNPLKVTLTNNTGKPVEIRRVDTSSEQGEDFGVDDDYEFIETTNRGREELQHRSRILSSRTWRANVIPLDNLRRPWIIHKKYSQEATGSNRAGDPDAVSWIR